MRPGDHALLDYASDAEHEHVVKGFVQDGLLGGRRVISVGECPGVRADAYAGAGLLRVLEPARFRLAGGGFDPDRLYGRLCKEIRRAEEAGQTPIRVALGLTWVLDEPAGFERLMDCERMFKEALGPSGTVMALCRIDRRRVRAAELAALRGLHGPMVCGDPEYVDSVLTLVRTFEPPGLVIRGEIDAARHTALERALRGIEGAHELRLDLADLRFIDFGGLRLLADFAVERTLVLDNVPAQLRTVMEIVGWTGLPGLRLTGAAAP
jgi:anti-anti-sigma regulatory factor